MYDRYTITVDKQKLGELTQYPVTDNYVPTYNAGPGQQLPIVKNNNVNQLTYGYWGTIPSWSKNKPVSTKLLNMSLTTLEKKLSSRPTIKSRRCLALADGFYVWKKISKKQKTPYYFWSKDIPFFFLPGLWEEFEVDNKIFCTFILLSMESHGIISANDSEMPAIIKYELRNKWLSINPDLNDLKELLDDFPYQNLSYHPVTPKIADLSYDNPSLIESTPPSDQHGNLTLFN
ncbi:MAG TPA: SOS response-associated peptidase [Cyclobacteriaceae bacterium]